MKKKKANEFIHCRVSFTTRPSSPWRVAYPVERAGEKIRKRKHFSTEAAALSFARHTEHEILNHGIRFGELPPEARRAFDFYRDTYLELAEAGANPPPFDELVREAVQNLREKFEAMHGVTVAEAVSEFLEYKKARAGELHFRDLKLRLGRFARDHGQQAVAAVTTAELGSWLASLRNAKGEALGANTRNHFRAALSSLYKFAAAPGRGWAPRNPLEDLEPEKVKTSEPLAYTPQDAAKLMNTAADHYSELLPMLALGMFAGLRVSEAMAFELETITGDEKEFRVASGKTGARLAPLTAAAAAWLSTQPRRDGTAWQGTGEAYNVKMRQLHKLAGVDRIKNGMRHSFISYRTAQTRDVARVSDECGNSPVMIKKNYRQIVTTDAAKAFFSIMPKSEIERNNTKC